MSRKVGSLEIDFISKIAQVRGDVATLRGDFKKFRDEQKEGNESLAKSFESMKGRITSALALGGATAVVVGLAKSLYEVNKGFADMVDAAENAGVSVRDFAALKIVAQDSGAQVDSFTTAIGKLREKTEDAMRGGKDSTAVFQQMGIKLSDFANASDIERIELVGRYLNSNASEAKKTALMYELLGQKLAGKVLSGFKELGEGVNASTAKMAAQQELIALRADLLDKKLEKAKEKAKTIAAEMTQEFLTNEYDLVEASKKLSLEGIKELMPAMETELKKYANHPFNQAYQVMEYRIQKVIEALNKRKTELEDVKKVDADYTNQVIQSTEAAKREAERVKEANEAYSQLKETLSAIKSIRNFDERKKAIDNVRINYTTKYAGGDGENPLGMIDPEFQRQIRAKQDAYNDLNKDIADKTESDAEKAATDALNKKSAAMDKLTDLSQRYYTAEQKHLENLRQIDELEKNTGSTAEAKAKAADARVRENTNYAQSLSGYKLAEQYVEENINVNEVLAQKQKEITAGVKAYADQYPELGIKVDAVTKKIIYQQSEIGKFTERSQERVKDSVADSLTALVTNYRDAGQAIRGIVSNLATSIINEYMRVIVVEKMMQWIRAASTATSVAAGAGSATTPATNSSGNAGGSFFGPTWKPTTVTMPRASGGPVRAGSNYLVGEMGQEFFTPSQDGYIINAANTSAIAAALRAGGGSSAGVTQVNNIHINKADDLQLMINKNKRPLAESAMTFANAAHLYGR